MNRNPEVDEFLNELDHPLRNEIDMIRELILDFHPDIEETIKWKSPTFLYKGNMASFYINAKKHVSLMFHKGALIEDSSGLLQGEGKETRTIKFVDAEDINKKSDGLRKIVKNYMDMQDD